jgi:hypothetical protein
MKEFIDMKEGSQNKEMSDILSKMPQGTRLDNGISKKRLGLEKSFEWELLYSH